MQGFLFLGAWPPRPHSCGRTASRCLHCDAFMRRDSLRSLTFGAPPAGECPRDLPTAIRRRAGARRGGATAAASSGGALSHRPFPYEAATACSAHILLAAGGFCKAGAVVSCAASPRRRHKNMRRLPRKDTAAPAGADFISRFKAAFKPFFCDLNHIKFHENQ